MRKLPHLLCSHQDSIQFAYKSNFFQSFNANILLYDEQII